VEQSFLYVEITHIIPIFEEIIIIFCFSSFIEVVKNNLTELSKNIDIFISIFYSLYKVSVNRNVFPLYGNSEFLRK